MKKIVRYTLLLSLFIFINSCAGYKPIFSTEDLNFKISNYLLEGNKQIGKQIYYKIYSISNRENVSNAQSLDITINVNKDKKATVKDSAGKILEYKILLDTKITVKDYLTNKNLFTQNSSSSLSYRVQDQYSETIKIENRTIDNMVDKIFQDLLIKMGNII